MNPVISQLKSLTDDPESRAAAITKLQEIAHGKDEKATDARFVLQGLGCPHAGQKAKAVDATVCNLPIEDVNHPDHFFWIMERQKEKESQFYDKALADGWSHAETVAKWKQAHGINSAMRYDCAQVQIECHKKEGAYAVRTYCLPHLRKELEEVRKWRPYDWCTVALIEETIAAFPEPQPKQGA